MSIKDLIWQADASGHSLSAAVLSATETNACFNELKKAGLMGTITNVEPQSNGEAISVIELSSDLHMDELKAKFPGVAVIGVRDINKHAPGALSKQFNSRYWTKERFQEEVGPEVPYDAKNVNALIEDKKREHQSPQNKGQLRL